MTRHYHIITCDSENEMVNFITSGLVGVRPVLTKEPTKRKNETNEQRLRKWVANTVRMNWDILADLARIREGDYILLHTKGIIKGVFEVIGPPLVSQSLSHLFDGPNINVKNWFNNWDIVTQQVKSHAPMWWIPIKPLEKEYFAKMSMDIVFDNIAKGRITSLPPRLRYEDKNKTTKGILKKDFEVILELFYNYSFGEIAPANTPLLGDMMPITFDYLTEDRYEKNLEALIVHRIRSGKFEIIEKSPFEISKLQVSHSNVLNTVPLGYLKMADLLTWNERNARIINPWIWELKAHSLRWKDLKEEIKKLSARASYLNTFFGTKDRDFKISGVIVASSFSKDALSKFRELITPIGSVEELLLVEYQETGSNVRFELREEVHG